MSMFLCKPHVEGSEGNITSPDVIVDRVFIDGEVAPVNCLTHDAWQQAERDTSARAGYGVMALGGGELLLPVVVLGSGVIVVARSAWRLKHIEQHGGDVLLNGKRLSDIGLPQTEISAVSGLENVLPRGYLAIKTLSGDTRSGSTCESLLVDPALGRSLRHKVVLEPSSKDPWGSARPTPRYAEGPTKRDVQHYI